MNDGPKQTIIFDTLTLSDGTITIGRSDDNDVIINDGTVSSHHAKITTVFNASYVEDLGSTNGTFVNGKRADKHVLKDGDSVVFGMRGYTIHKPES